MEAIKMVDLKKQYLQIKLEIDAAMQAVIDQTSFIQGAQVHSFSQALGTFNKVNHVITCGNGTDALQLALMALELEPGDEVIVPAHTYVATVEVICLLGLMPVFIDVNENSFNLDTTQLERIISPKTKAIIPVHLYGQCADMEPILTIADRHNLFVIEDAAQAIGAEYTFSNGRTMKAGTMGIIGCTSFFPSKNLGCFGDGGAIFTNHEVLAKRIQITANHGQHIKYHHDVVGINSRLDTLQAAVLEVKLKYLSDYNRKRNSVASFYDEQLKQLVGIRRPWHAPNSTHVYNQYTLTIEGNRRNEFQSYLKTKEIPSMIYYPVPLPHQKAYASKYGTEGTFPVTEKLSNSVISLPIHTELTDLQLEYITDAVKAFFK